VPRKFTCIAGSEGSTEIFAVLDWPAVTATGDGASFPPANVARKFVLALAAPTTLILAMATGPLAGCA
jgi:hypothetical protein